MLLTSELPLQLQYLKAFYVNQKTTTTHSHSHSVEQSSEYAAIVPLLVQVYNTLLLTIVITLYMSTPELFTL